MKISHSPISQHNFHGFDFFLKRDDLLHKSFSGNKARKFTALLENTDKEIKSIISYGSAQSNAMYSLAALAKLKGWQFEYYVKQIPSWLKENPLGNYKAALDLGMKIFSLQQINSDLHPSQYIEKVRGLTASCLLVPEGGKASIAEKGVKQLAQEIREWIDENAITSDKKEDFVVALPSGTGTTALYLQKHLASANISVLTCPCVGDSHYLTQQFLTLESSYHPKILENKNKHHFGHLYREEYEIWQTLCQQTQVEFDLLYDPYMWLTLLPWLKQNPNKKLIYIHQGGLLGNESMQLRYQRAFPHI